MVYGINFLSNTGPGVVAWNHLYEGMIPGVRGNECCSSPVLKKSLEGVFKLCDYILD